MKILVTSSSFLDTPGEHLTELTRSGLEVIPARGPLKSEMIREIATTRGPFDGILCGEDDLDGSALESLKPQLKVISKYGVGLDRIDVKRAEELKIPVFNTPGSNHVTVCELTFGLMLSLVRNIPKHNSEMHAGVWRKATGSEIAGKTLGIFGFGRVGREVAIRALAFGMNVSVFNGSLTKNLRTNIEELNALFSATLFKDSNAPSIVAEKAAEAVLRNSDIISLHMNLSAENRGYFNRDSLLMCRRGALLINVSRAGLVNQQHVAELLQSGHLGGYGADVVDPEPISSDNPLLGLKNVVLTPHIGSRTVESVQRQGIMALKNLMSVLLSS